MKKMLLAYVLTLVLVSFNAFAADGDLVVNGKTSVEGDIRAGNSSAACTSANEGALRYNSTFKKMEFCNGSAWKAMGVAYRSQYPPAQSATYVKATSQYSTNWVPYFTTNPSEPLTGAAVLNSWLSNSPTNQRFHIDLGSAKIIKRIYYENASDSGGATNCGIKTFTFWGSNNATAFSTLTYGTDTNWTQLPTSQSTFDQHVGVNVTDPKFITVTNSIAYRYYAIKIADDWGNTTYMGARRIELQIEE